MVAETGIGSQHITDGKAPFKNFQGCEIPISQALQNSEWCAKNFTWVAKFRTLYEIFVGVAKPHAKSTGQTSDDHNYLVQTLIRAFLESLERSLSLESNHMPFNGIWFS